MKNTMKKLLSLLLVLTMTAGIAPLSGFTGLKLPEWSGFSIVSSAIETSGSCSDNINWLFDESKGTLNIFGTGEMNNYSFDEETPWENYKGSIKTITIYEGITSIGDYAFKDCNSLESVSIPDSVTNIGNCAFAFCASLVEISIPKNVLCIGISAFEDCTKLEMVNVNAADCVCKLGTKTNLGPFVGCLSLTEFDFGENVKKIPDGIFAGMESLISFSVQEGIETIGSNAFSNCFNLKEVNIPKSVNTIGSAAFFCCSSLEYVELPTNISRIESSTFAYCEKLKTFIIPENVISIGDSAFSDCESLENITIPQNIALIDSCAFSNCGNIKNVFYFGTIYDWISIEFDNGDSNPLMFAKNLYLNGKLFDGNLAISNINIDINKYAFYSFSGITNVIVDSEKTAICDYAFEGCENLKSVSINVEFLGRYAFAECSSLQKVVVFGEALQYVGVGAFKNCVELSELNLGSTLTYISDAAFAYCEKLTDVTIPDSVIALYDIKGWAIAGNVFAYCTNLKRVEIGEGLNKISLRCFNGCENLTEIVLHNNIGEIADAVFKDCNNINDIYYTGSEDEWGTIIIGDNNENLLNAEIHYDSIIVHSHSYTSITINPTCSKNGYTTYVCKCGDSYTADYKSEIDHTWTKWVVTNEPTETENGVKVRSCKVCENAAEIEVISAVGSSDETGKGIIITLTDEEGDIIVQEIVSDYNADVLFENGTYTLTISKENYVARAYAVTAADNMMSLDFSLNKAGDITGDGKVNTIDVARANSHAKGVSNLVDYDFDCADINGDDKVNTIDVARINSHAKGVITLW